MSGVPEHLAAAAIATTDPKLKELVGDALSRLGNIVVLHRLNRGAGRRDWYVLSKACDLDHVLECGRMRDAFTFFLRAQLPIRGLVDDALAVRLAAALDTIPENTSELLVARAVPGQPLLEACEGFSRGECSELHSWLREHRGEYVIGGEHPPLFSRDSNELVTAIVPDELGNVEVGVY